MIKSLTEKSIASRYKRLLKEYATPDRELFNTLANIEKTLNISISELSKIAEKMINSDNDLYKNIGELLKNNTIPELDNLILNDYKEYSLASIKTKLEEK